MRLTYCAEFNILFQLLLLCISFWKTWIKEANVLFDIGPNMDPHYYMSRQNEITVHLVDLEI